MEAEYATVEKAKRGDQAAFLQLLAPLEKRLYYVGLSIMGNKHDAQDLWQSTVLRAWQHLPKLRKAGSFQHWLTRLLLNQAKTMLKSRNSSPLPSNELPEVEDSQLSRDDYLAVHASLQQLPLEQREAVVLRFWLDMKLKDIASITGVPLSTAKTRLYKGMDALHSLLSEEVNGCG